MQNQISVKMNEIVGERCSSSTWDLHRLKLKLQRRDIVFHFFLAAILPCWKIICFHFWTQETNIGPEEERTNLKSQRRTKRNKEPLSSFQLSNGNYNINKKSIWKDSISSLISWQLSKNEEVTWKCWENMRKSIIWRSIKLLKFLMSRPFLCTST